MSAPNPRRSRSAAFIAAGIAAGIIGAWGLSANGQGGTTSGSGIPGTSITSTTSGTSGTSGKSGPSQPAVLPALPAPIGGEDGGDGGNHGGDR